MQRRSNSNNPERKMRRMIMVVGAWTWMCGIAVAQLPEVAPSPAERLFQPPQIIPAEADATEPVHSRRWYAAGGVLVAPPIFYDSAKRGNTAVLPPLPSPWATVGFHRDNDVSWQSSFLLVPVYVPHAVAFGSPLILTTAGIDIDRISTNRSERPNLDCRWQAGLRVVGVGINGIPLPLAIGPHVGLRLE